MPSLFPFGSVLGRGKPVRSPAEEKVTPPCGRGRALSRLKAMGVAP
jgi:hypothetical protein